MMAISMFLIVTGGVGDTENTRAFAWSRTHAPGKFGEVVGLVQAVECLPPATPVDEIVPLGDQIVDWAAVVGLAEGDAAVHAAGALGGEACPVVRGEDLVEVEQAHRGVPIGRRFPRELLEPGDLAHVSTVRQPLARPPVKEPVKCSGRRRDGCKVRLPR